MRGAANSGTAATKIALYQDAEKPPEHLKFVHEFSSADDVRRGLPPAVDRSLDIIAGQADPRALPDKLVGPYGVVTDSTHRIIVTDPDAGLVHVFDFERSRYSVLGGRGSRLRSPTGVAVDREDNIYVTDPSVVAVLVYDSKGKFQRYLGKKGDESYFQAPMGIAIDAASGHVYVCDSRRHMVLMLDEKGHILGHFGKRWGGKGPGDFKYPKRIVIAGDEIFVLDSGNSRLQILDLGGHYRREIKFPELSADAGLALDDRKNIYVSDLQINAINVFNYDGQFLYRFGRSGTKPGEFDEPSGLWVEPGNRLYVADTKNKRVQLFQIVADR
jgi:DNA-binding beta-propeller fold protein YncE